MLVQQANINIPASSTGVQPGQTAATTTPTTTPAGAASNMPVISQMVIAPAAGQQMPTPAIQRVSCDNTE
jgi:hypothetical protein